jgi:hypothetical protein
VTLSANEKSGASPKQNKMKKILAITIDVEPDCTPTWRYSDPLTFRGVYIGIKEKLQPLFIKHNITPTYLINNVVLEDAPSVTVLKNLEGNFELGSHLHPEFIEPRKEFQNYAGKRGEANCCHYPHEVEFEKIKNITALFEKSFGYLPTSFRAGRFSAGNNTIKSLIRLGYKVDTSVTPHVIWSDSTRAEKVDFSTAKDQPYFMNENSILEEDPLGKLLQVPVTIALKKAPLLKELRISKFGLRSPIRRVVPSWLRPAYSSTQDLLGITNQFSKRNENSSVLVLNMMFHNVEVLPKLSPYTKTEADCEAYMQQLEDFFKYCTRNNFESVGLTSLYEHYRKK